MKMTTDKPMVGVKQITSLRSLRIEDEKEIRDALYKKYGVAEKQMNACYVLYTLAVIPVILDVSYNNDVSYGYMVEKAEKLYEVVDMD